MIFRCVTTCCSRCMHSCHPRSAYRLAAQQADFFRRKRDEEALIRTQMQVALPDATAVQLDGWIDDYYRMVEQEALDTWYLQHQPIQNIVELQGFEAIEQARQQGKRVLLTGGHFGRFWMAGAAMRARGLPQERLPVMVAIPIATGCIRRNTVTVYLSCNACNRRWAGRFWWKGMSCVRCTVRL